MPKTTENELKAFTCPTHGFIVETVPRASVFCKCGKAAIENPKTKGKRTSR